MEKLRNRLCGLAFAIASVVLLSAGPSFAQSAIPCSAFIRTPYGAWRVTSPVMIEFGDRLYSPTVGTVFAAGAIHNGIEMSDVLDQQCGNR